MIFLNKSPKPPPVKTSINKSPKVGLFICNLLIRNLDNFLLLMYAINAVVTMNNINVPTNPPRM